LWLAIKESTERTSPALSFIDRKQRAVILMGVVLTLPLIETAHFGTRFIADPPIHTLLEPAIHVTMLLCLALFAVQVPFYLWRCRRLLPVAPEDRWLKIPLFIVGTTWLLGVLRTVIGAFSMGSPGFFAWIAFVDVSVTIGAVYLIVRRVAWQPAHVQAKYAKSLLGSAIRARIVRKLEIAFATQRLYQDAELSLGSLSRRIHENEHYVSQVINQELNCSFYEYVNARRIEHAKQLLIESPDQNVLDIALSVGFNAKSTFNSAFRRHTGITPREFRTQARGQTGRIAPLND
jgi:AraC-like DNA-binding protein